MTPEQFENLRDDFMVQEARILDHKRSEYCSDSDRLQNFREVAEFLGQRPAEVSLAYLLKHIQSIALAVRTGKYSRTWHTDHGEGLKQRIADARNYLLLLAACLEEESKEEAVENSPDENDLALIADVVPDYSLGRRRGLTDEETERRAREAFSRIVESS